MEIPISIYTRDNQVIRNLLDGGRIVGTQLADGVSVESSRIKIREALDYETEIQIVLGIAATVAKDVAADLISDYLIKKFHGDETKLTHLQIDGMPLELDKDKITKVIYEKMRRIS